MAGIVEKNIIFGLGTGRCGTVSLSKLLSSQEDCAITHELSKFRLPWEKNVNQFDFIMNSINSRSQKFIGDVGFYYLPYVEEILKNKNSKIIILKREKQKVISSYVKKTTSMNHWNEHDGKHWLFNSWDHCFPKFKTRTKEEAISKYYDHYYDLCQRISQENCFWINTEDLNNESVCLEMLKWCGFENPRFFIKHENRILT